MEKMENNYGKINLWRQHWFRKKRKKQNMKRQHSQGGLQ